MKIDFSEQDIQNLWIFLNRVQIQGTEAVTLTLLLQKIQQARELAGIPEVKDEKPTTGQDRRKD